MFFCIFVSVWNSSLIQYSHSLSCLVLYKVALSTIYYHHLVIIKGTYIIGYNIFLLTFIITPNPWLVTLFSY